MKRILFFLILLLPSIAFAADNAVIVTPGTGVTMKSKDIGSGVQAMQPVLSDTTGTPYGSANPFPITSFSSGAITNPASSALTLPTRTIASSANAVPAASPCVFTFTANNLVNGQTVVLSGTTAPGTAQFVFGTPYYVVARATNTFELASTLGGGAINCTTTAGVAVVATMTYEPGDIIADNATAGSIGSHTFAIATTAGGGIIPYLTLRTSATTGWNGSQISVTLYRAAPTYTNGDMSTWAPATGSANYLGTYTGTLIQMGDGAVGNLYPTSQVSLMPNLTSGTSIFWDMQLVNVPSVPITAQTFTLTGYVLN